MKLITDDWGLSPSINEAALWLAKKDLLFGISVLADAAHSKYLLKETSQNTGILVGCHLNFTDNFKDRPGNLPRKFLSLAVSAFFRPAQYESEVERQVQKVRALAGRIDYLDGHHHVHLLPGLFPAVAKVARKYSLPLRNILDRSHNGTWLLGTWAKKRNARIDWVNCRYLTQRDWASPEKMQLKSRESGKMPVVCHPSVRDDFQELGIHDPLQRERVDQFEALKHLRGYES